jgi:arylsulfatase A-like enzyme/Flp pilus assembly protein TadD
MIRRALLVAAVVSIAAQIACDRTASRANASLQPDALARSNVLLITVDTLRVDRVGAYGGGSLTPSLDALAARGVRFTRAHAHAPLTLPAHTSIMTGLVPATHGVHNNGVAGLTPTMPTLASVVHGAGYRTAAFVGAFVLDARFGLSQGFDTYDDRVGSDTGPVTFAFAERTADRVTQLAGDWILGSRSSGSPPPASSPWFCWIHLFDPHAPYRAPEQRVPNPYENEIAFTDAQIGRFLDRLRAARQLDRTVVIMLADHGEALGDHGEATHGLFAYDATLRIPLLIAGPSIPSRVSDVAAGQADVLPTVLDLLGITPPSRIDGASLLPALRGDPVLTRPLYFEALDAYLTRNWAPLTGIIVDNWKYIDLPEPELYDLGSDPFEQRNRINDERDRAAVLRRRLAEWPPPSTALTSATRSPLDPDAEARLRALGYTATQAAPHAGRRYTSDDDPKRLLDLHRRYEDALTLTGERRYSDAASLLQSVIADRPDFNVAYLNLASVFIAGGDAQRAIALLEGAAKRGITSPELQGRLGAARLASGDLRRAAAILEPIADVSRPGGIEAANTLGVVLTQLGRHVRARKLFSDVLARSPQSATAWSNLGLLELADRRPEEAARAFERAVAADPRLGQAWEGLGAARARSNPSSAIDAWRRALELEPRNYDLLFNIAALLHEQGRTEEARPYVERFVREAPADRYARDITTVRGWLAK